MATETTYTMHFSRYPYGPASQMAQDEIVLLRCTNGSLADTYVGELEVGNEYTLRLPRSIKRTGLEIFEYLSSRAFNVEYSSRAKGAAPDALVISDGITGDVLVKYPYDDSSSLREALEFLMDQEEL